MELSTSCECSASHPGTDRPSPWVAAHLPVAEAGQRLLDVACGGGRHTRLALARGYLVTAVDRDVAQMADLAGQPRVEIVAADLEMDRGDMATAPPFAGKTYDVVIVTNYLWRPLFPAIVSAVAPGGLLIYETFARGQEAFGKPSNPDFLLEPGELLARMCPELIPIAFEQGLLTGPDRFVQRLTAAGRERSIHHPLPSIRPETAV
ncbi:MAG: methyltransferase domain-containing protein [Hyphomicrobium aestuarii]|nr:methyltransferase domain-containing protein [Hyphomicrobium aestuarii]